jgi:hypothetical protein
MFGKNLIYILSILFFSYLETNIPQIYSIETVPLIHHIVTTSITNYMLFNNTDFMLNVFDYKQEEIHPVIAYFPIFSCAYGLYDLYSVIYYSRKIDFMLHGIFFSTAGLLFMHYENFHWLYPGLLMETSSVFLLLNKLPHNVIKMFFVLTFIFYRNLLFPYISIIFMKNKYYVLLESEHYQEKGILFFMFCMNILNYYWGYKIVKKVIRHIKNE